MEEIVCKFPFVLYVSPCSKNSIGMSDIGKMDFLGQDQAELLDQNRWNELRSTNRICRLKILAMPVNEMLPAHNLSPRTEIYQDKTKCIFVIALTKSFVIDFIHEEKYWLCN